MVKSFIICFGLKAIQKFTPFVIYDEFSNHNLAECILFFKVFTTPYFSSILFYLKKLLYLIRLASIGPPCIYTDIYISTFS